MTEEDEIDLLEENEEIEKPKKKVVKKTFENPAPKAVIKKKIIVKIPTPPPENESEEEEEEEQPKPVKQKRERTQKQIDAFNRCIEIKKEKAKQRSDEAKRLAEYDRKALEEKVVKKAISIKKKQIKKQSALDEISDDDTPIEKIKEVSKTIKPVAPVKPVVAFKFI
jgi:hypothetical protein